MSKSFLVLVLTEPTHGAEDEFNDYYENTHLDEVIETTGWKSAQRFRLAGEAGESCPLPYLASYEGCYPVTWVAFFTGHIGDTFSLNGLSSGSTRQSSSSK